VRRIQGCFGEAYGNVPRKPDSIRGFYRNVVNEDHICSGINTDGPHISMDSIDRVRKLS
jgi:hypothetical protein